MTRKVVAVTASLLLLGLCLWLLWPSPTEWQTIVTTLAQVWGGEEHGLLWLYAALLPAVHLLKTRRWGLLLEALGARIRFRDLLAVCSVGFLAGLALPARLGEFVRPALIRRTGKVSGSQALGTVALERVLDTLFVSLFLAVAVWMLPEPPLWLVSTTVIACAAATAVLVLLFLGLSRKDEAVALFLRISLLPRFAPRLAEAVGNRARGIVEGLAMLKSPRAMVQFVLWTAVLWLLVGAQLWSLGKAVGLALPPAAAALTTALLGIGASVPNTPGMVGQYHGIVVVAVSLYTGMAIAKTEGLAFAILLHASQLGWHLVTGVLALASPKVTVTAGSDRRERRAHR